MSNFKETSIDEIIINPFSSIKKDGFLITAGKSKDNYNTMTANWATLGTIWNKPIVNILVRPQRYTFQFIESNTNFSISFFSDEYKSTLAFCGKESGRNINKAEKTGLKSIFDENTVYFEQAKLVLICKKLYFFDLEKSKFIEKGLESFYTEKDYHRNYIAEVKKALINV